MSAILIRCPRGHSWDPAEFDDDPGPAIGPVACPYCGALCGETRASFDRSQFFEARADEADDSPKIPGYQILGVLGRGGMGVVYKARQVRTDRVIALKLPGHLDLETRARFTTEAQAAARVSHPNIVQVYEVGEHQGQPFLALEYIDGGSLAERLTGAPVPPRQVAALAEVVARAVGAAHAHGVIHRDLKPGNILLAEANGSSIRGPASLLGGNIGSLNPKIADFGLARRLDVEVGQTRSGTILGTPDYMAPEQAAGDSRALGPPADVWALGVVLYEMLTGRPPFRGTGMLETLEQVRALDPVPPRRLQPSIPRDLETIALKCLHKEPDRRYPTASELADDLRQFLDGLPVRARPVSRVERWVKRAKRNPLATALAAGLWLVVLAAAGYGVWYHLRLQAQRDRARYHFQMSVRSIEELLTEVADEDLALEPRAELKRQALLEKALAFYDELLRVEPDDPGLAWLGARAARRVGDIYRLLARHAEAIAAYDRAIERLTPFESNALPGTDPTREIADCHNFTGEIYRLKGEPNSAIAPYRRALAIQQELVKSHADNAGYRHDLSRTHYNLGVVAWQTNRATDAVAELGEAAQILDGLPVNEVAQRHHRARIDLNLGPALRATERLDDADAACVRAISQYDLLVRDFPKRLEFQFEQSQALINQGIVRWSRRDWPRARTALAQATESLERLAQSFPDTPQYKSELARTNNTLAAVAFAEKKTAEAAEFSKKAADQWAALSAANPDSGEYHGELGISLGNQGRVLLKSDPVAARTVLTRGLFEVLRALESNVDGKAYLISARKQSNDLADLLIGADAHDDARKLARRIAAEFPRNRRRALALLASFLTACERHKTSAAEIEPYELLAIELTKGLGSSDFSALRADPDCAALVNRPTFAKAIEGR